MAKKDKRKQSRDFLIQKVLSLMGFWFNLSCTKKIFFLSSSFFQFLHLKNALHYIFYVYRFLSGGRLLGLLDVYCYSIIFCFGAGGLPFLYSGGAYFIRSLRLLDHRARYRNPKMFGCCDVAATYRTNSNRHKWCGRMIAGIYKIIKPICQ